MVLKDEGKGMEVGCVGVWEMGGGCWIRGKRKGEWVIPVKGTDDGGDATCASHAVDAFTLVRLPCFIISFLPDLFSRLIFIPPPPLLSPTFPFTPLPPPSPPPLSPTHPTMCLVFFSPPYLPSFHPFLLLF